MQRKGSGYFLNILSNTEVLLKGNEIKGDMMKFV
jgi:hypothetical protein